jgi:DNA-binding response OmpR family regulator
MLIRDRTSQLQVQEGLAVAGFEGVGFCDVTQLLRSLRREDCRLLVIDVDMPGEDWSAVISQLHDAAAQQLLVVGVGALPHGASLALDGGADEFVPLPLSAQELRSRIRAALRREERVYAPVTSLACGPCALDLAGQQLVSTRARIDLTAREAALARQLFQSPGGLVSRRALARIWEIDEDLAGRSIEQHVYQLRRKLRLCVGNALALRSVYARGYQLECVAAQNAEALRQHEPPAISAPVV